MLQGKAVVGAILLTLSCGCTPTGKQTPSVAAVEPSQPGPEAAGPAPSAATPAMRVFIDPVTGEQRIPTAEEWEEIVRQQQKVKVEVEAAGDTAPSSPREMTLPDGMRGYVLGDAAKSSLRACTGPDGATVVGHDCPPSTPSTAPVAPAGVQNEAAQ